MLRGLYTAAFGMRHNQAKQDSTANNIANSTTPGYKQDKLVTKPFPKVILQNMAKTEFGKPAAQELGTMTFGVESGESYTDFNQGPAENTGEDLDFAINGKGFFTVQYFDGIAQTTNYTRNGSFKLDAEGNLVTSEGGLVMGQNIETGNIEPMRVGAGKVTADIDGNVFVDSAKRYSFQISDFDNYNNLEKLGKGMYGLIDNQGSEAVQAIQGEYNINQGQIEQSNVDITSEMVNMITSLRSYQANQRALQSIDQTLSKAVNEVGSLR